MTIEPKLPEVPLAALLRYAYGLRDLRLHNETTHAATRGGLRDLLVRQLVDEAEELVARGLHRDYERRAEDLASPRGRLDFVALAGVAGRARAALPCVHHPRTEANPINVALLGAVTLGARVVAEPTLRHRAARLARSIEGVVPQVVLTAAALDRVEESMDRRHRAYHPCLRIARLLLEGSGTSLEPGTPVVPLPGFLFDMNRFFQVLLSRFLSEHLTDYQIEDEQVLRGMFAWEKDMNPLGRGAPAPRPDFIVRQEGRVVAILDAKYRDLWETALPSEMLYQLTHYALGHRGSAREAVILYPTLGRSPREQAVALRDPNGGGRLARVVLRPVNLQVLTAALAAGRGSEGLRLRGAIAAELAFGARPPGRHDPSRDSTVLY